MTEFLPVEMSSCLNLLASAMVAVFHYSDKMTLYVTWTDVWSVDL